MTKAERMVKENAEYNCNGVVYGYNQKTGKFYMEPETGNQDLHYEFADRTHQYFDMLAHINRCYL